MITTFPDTDLAHATGQDGGVQHASWLALEAVPFVPEVLLHQADDMHALWESLGTSAPPYWAFPWLGGQALARYVLDEADLTGKRVLDLATGSGLVAIAAMRAGARSVLACDIDPLSAEAVAANAAANDVEVMWTGLDLLDSRSRQDLQRLVGFLQRPENRARRVLLMGFANPDPRSPYAALSLSQERADYVSSELLAANLKVVTVRGFGGKRPLADARQPLARWRNERVEVWLR